ncbi:predicted protein [Chaetoceros tenuissimus]|uniref:Uncharacterized protein n=1 Tax=Chaetoceros tenuissimus TaxID=426638 RepID=A0AAD3CJC5_9STRA|nr:predicted protein [Chaetoceros tenuissimus]
MILNKSKAILAALGLASISAASAKQTGENYPFSARVWCVTKGGLPCEDLYDIDTRPMICGDRVVTMHYEYCNELASNNVQAKAPRVEVKYRNQLQSVTWYRTSNDQVVDILEPMRGYECRKTEHTTIINNSVYNLSGPSLFGSLILENMSYIGLPESVSLNSILNNESIYLIDGYTDFSIYICRSVDADTRAELLSIHENARGQRLLRLSAASSLGKKIWRVIKQLQRCYKNSTYPWPDRPMPCGVSVVIASGGLGYREGFDSEIEHEIIALFDDR